MFDMNSIWVRSGFDMGSIRIRYVLDLVLIWVHPGFDMGAIWIRYGFDLDSI